MSGSQVGGGLRKRVWQAARAEPDADGFRIMLDQRPLHLPGGAVLRLRSELLAQAVAAEWQAAGGGVVGGVFGPDTLAMTRLAGTQQVRVAPNRAAVVATLLGYAAGDLLCYRASHPQGLVARQQADWQPWLDWCADRHGARLAVTRGVMPVAQAPDAVAALAAALDAEDDSSLTALGVLVPALGSLVLGLAVVDGALEADAAAELALLDESHQQETWGEDQEAATLRSALLREVGEAARFLALARAGTRAEAGVETAVSRQWLVSGIVQGVGYRAWLSAEATRLGVVGWVRNLQDRRVEALLRATPSVLAELLALAHHGPPSARVTAIAVRSWPGEVPGSGFTQRPTASSAL